jgi:hypothetical protein
MPNNMTMNEIHRYCEDKAKRREARAIKLNLDLDKIQEQINNALATIDKELNDKVDK